MNDIAAEPEDGWVHPVGSSAARLDIAEKITGRAQYIADLSRPFMLHGAIVQSPHAHARILGFDLAAAQALPGVVCILTGRDIGKGLTGPFIKDEPVLPTDKVRYAGEPVAIIAAEDEATARAAARLVVVEYDRLPEILSPEQGLAENAALVHENSAEYVRVHATEAAGNVAWSCSFAEGDVDAAFAQCDVVVSGEYRTQAQAHVALEPCGALAEIDGNGRVTLWSANQSVFRVQANVCEGLGLPMSRLRCITPKVGGGFGNKMEQHVQSFAVALALVTLRPVKLILSREEDFQMVRHRHPYVVRVKTGATKSGELLARDVELLVDCGAYGDDSPGVMGFSLLMARGPYRIAHSRARGTLVYTNKVRFGAFRGFGNPQMSFATEAQLDEVARLLDIDPLELRLRNAVRKNDSWVGGGAVTSDGFVRCLEAVRDAARWGSAPPPPVRPGWRQGRGLACSSHISGLLAASAIVRVLEDGSMALNTGAVDIGQGCDTILAQMLAEALQVPLESITVAVPDTDGSPYNWGTTASRVTYMVGRSVVAAAAQVEQALRQHGSEMLECSPDDLELRPGGRIGIAGVPGMEVSFRDISLRAHWARGGPIIGHDSQLYDKPTIDPKRTMASGVPFPQIGVFSFAAIICDIAVEEATGKIEVMEAWSACDVGRAINPASVEGQIEGGFVQGLGFSLAEELVWQGAHIANPNLNDYKIPTFLDVPDALHPLIVEDPEPDGPFGAKGIGEISICSVAPAIANALADATGLRLRALPLTPERVFMGSLAAAPGFGKPGVLS